DRSDVVGLVGGAGNLELLELDAEAALLAHAQAARHPDAGARAARDHGRGRHRPRRLAEERHRYAGAVVQVANEAQPAALAHEIHDAPGGSVALPAVSSLAKQSAGI